MTPRQRSQFAYTKAPSGMTSYSAFAGPHLSVSRLEAGDEDGEHDMPPSRTTFASSKNRQNHLQPLIEDFDYVIAILDDISVEAFAIRDFLGLMKHNHLNVATPFVYLAPGSNFITQSIVDAVSEDDPRFKQVAAGYRSDQHMTVTSKNSLFGSLYKRGIAGTRLRAWEVQMTIFRKDAFYCWADMVDPSTNPIGWGYDMLYYDICNHASNIGFISGPRAEIFHLAERFLQGLSSNRYVQDDETFPMPKNVKAHYVRVGDLGSLNDNGVGGAKDARARSRKEQARQKALNKARSSSVRGVAGSGEAAAAAVPVEALEANKIYQDDSSAEDEEEEKGFHGIWGLGSDLQKELVQTNTNAYVEVIGQYQIAEAMMENWLKKKRLTPYWEKEKLEKDRVEKVIRERKIDMCKNSVNSTAAPVLEQQGVEVGVSAEVGHDTTPSSAEHNDEDEEAAFSAAVLDHKITVAARECEELASGAFEDRLDTGEGDETKTSSGSSAPSWDNALDDSRGFVVKACLVALEDDLMFLNDPSKAEAHTRTMRGSLQL
ncbi:unnamed protein product [Amoebophrya sp. A25]|nr:unnamed protein product [Amoebophrya sp. A25]|eukprot:GSA25T00026999001.1